MSIDSIGPGVPPLPGDRIPQTGAAQGGAPARFAQVYELEEARRRRMTGPGAIPNEVWADMERASALADELSDSGQRVAFGTHHVTGRVVATLVDGDESAGRALTLRDVVSLDLGPAPAA